MKRVVIYTLVLLGCSACGPDLKKIKQEIGGGIKETIQDVTGALKAQLENFREEKSQSKAKVLQMLSQAVDHLTEAQGISSNRRPGKLLKAISLFHFLRSNIASHPSDPNGDGLRRLYSGWEQRLEGSTDSRGIGGVLMQLRELREEWSRE